MSHFSVFRAKALQSPAHPAPLLTGPRRYTKPVFQRSTEPGNLFSLTSFACLLMPIY